MKHIILSLLLSVIVYGSGKQIIIGSYLDENNSINELKELSIYIKNDDKLRFLIEKNKLKAINKKIENYFVVAILPVENYVQLLRTLDSLKIYYPDVYVIDIPIVQTVVKPDSSKVEVVVKTKPIMKREEPTLKKEKVVIKPKEPKDITMQNKDFLLLLLALIIISFIIYMRKKAKKEE